MKNLAILFITLLFINPSYAQRWSSAFVGKPESRALYASNVAKAIQNAWENEITNKEKKESLLDEIVFGSNQDFRINNLDNIDKLITANIDEIEEGLGIKEIAKDPVKKKKIETPITEIPVSKDSPVSVSVVQTEENVMNPMGDIDEVKEAKKINKQAIPVNNINVIPEKKSDLIIKNDDIESDSVYAVPEISASFPGGLNSLKKFFVDNIKVPESTGKEVKGKVFVRFMVDKRGELSKVYFVKGLTDACNHEALRVVKKMPNWLPASQNGNAVSSWHTLPIYFEIEQ